MLEAKQPANKVSSNKLALSNQTINNTIFIFLFKIFTNDIRFKAEPIKISSAQGMN